jgi:hypothetical protein
MIFIVHTLHASSLFETEMDRVIQEFQNKISRPTLIALHHNGQIILFIYKVVALVQT